MLNFKRFISEKKDSGDPCWKDYVQIGTKKKNGKTVPNCVPKESAGAGRVRSGNYEII